jgi:hypothetical protein
VDEIESHAKPYSLGALRAEPGKIALTQAINGRQNAFFSKYGNKDAIIGQMNTSYSPNVPGSKPDRLARLRSLSVDQAQGLREAYAVDQVLGVVRDSSSTIHTEASGSSSGDDEGKSQAKAGNVLTTTNQHSDAVQHSQSDQTIANTYRAYRTPFFESQAQYERAQISLIDEQFNQFLYGQNLQELGTVFDNEKQSMDGDVCRLQVAFLNTILLSPIDGVVTGIYKNPGEWVNPGEAVVRVENNKSCLLVGRVVYRGRIVIGSTVTVNTKLFDAAGSTKVGGKVVAARGHDDDDEWEIVVLWEKNQDAAGDFLLPLSYQFDYDDTEMVIV